MKNDFKTRIQINPDEKILRIFIKKFWFIPSDVLQRSIEANIWSLVKINKPVLSIGIGNGELDSLLYKKQGVMDVGIDIDDSQFDKVKRLGIYNRVLKVSVEDLPFNKSTFNSVISNSTFEHIGNIGKAISEISRVLKEEGVLIFTTPSNYLQEWIFEHELNNGEEQAKGKLKKFNDRANHVNYLSIKEWEKLLSENGLKVYEHKYFFSKEVAVVWYRLFTFFTMKIRNKEIWSYLGQSKLTRMLPRGVILILEKKYLKKFFKNGFFVNRGVGAQHFIIAIKK